MSLAAKIDEHGGKAGWMTAMVMGFIFHWWIGLAILFFLIFSGRFRAWKYGHAPGTWYNKGESGDAQRGGPCAWTWNWGCGGGSRRQASMSGNRAFDEYRSETLKRLEEEQREFVEYLERLRQAKDKAEFDQFMADRRGRPTPPMDPNATNA